MQPSASIDRWCHSHITNEGNPLAERNTRWAMLLTAITMVAEIVGGWIYNSMALLADGWHMSSHALALGVAALAYSAARRFANDGRFAFGTWKIEILGGYTNAILLIGVAGFMLFHSVERLIAPMPIHYDQAIAIAVIGLFVNLACAWLLKGEHAHDHGHGHDHHHHDPHDHDLNLRSAYLHVLADAATSVFAILALFGGKYFAADWLDPLMGIVGSALVAIWAIGLLRDTGRVLLDAEMDTPVVAEIHEAIAASPIRAEITDLHVWRVAKGQYASIVSLAVDNGIDVEPEYFRRQIGIHEELVHITVEVNQREQPQEAVTRVRAGG